MKPKHEYTEEEINILEILDDPVFFGEFIRSNEDYEWEMDEGQKLILSDKSNYISLCSARSVGKTVTLETLIIYNTVSGKFKHSGENEVLFIVPNRAQLLPVFQRLAKLFRSHYLLRQYITNDSINYSRFEIRLFETDGSPGALIRCRIVGSSADSNIIGLHLPCILLDEAQLFPYSVWPSLQQVLISRDDNIQMIISGVPNGMREKNVLYESDMLVNTYKRYRISRLQTPRYKEADYKRDVQQYGGEDGDDFVNLVLGRHGSPSFSVFDRKMMRIENYPVEVSKVTDYFLKQSNGKFHQLIKAPEPPPDSKFIAIGMDLGFANDPSIFTILYQSKNDNKWYELARIRLERISYPVQCRIIDWLDNIYGFNLMCMDAGSSGLSVGQSLMDENGPYAAKKYNKRLVMVDFQGGVEVGEKEDGTRIKERVRRFTIQELQKWIQQDQSLVLSRQDEDLIEELERVGFVRDTLGQPRYFVYSPVGGKGGEDHTLASLLTWVYGYYFNYMHEAPNKVKRTYKQLFTGGWYVPPRV